MIKNLPSNTFAEKTILGASIVNKQAAITVLSSLKEDDFYVENFKNRSIFRALKEVNAKNIPIDLTTLTSQLESDKQIELIGGVDYLLELTNNVTEVANIEFYIKELRDTTLLRNLLLKMDGLIGEYESKSIPNFNDYILKCEREITSLTGQRKISGFASAKDLVESVGNLIISRYGNEGTITGLTTGFNDLNSYTNGFGKGNLVILAARSGVGKSALALNMAYLACQKSGDPVCVFSLEMTNEGLMSRLLSNRAGVDGNKIQTGFLNKEERLKIKEAQKEISTAQLYFDENSGTTIDDIILKTKKLKEEKGKLGLVVIDYINLINTGNRKYTNEQEKIQDFSRLLKVLSLDTEVPILCLAQINRLVDKQDSKIPQLADLKSSGAIEENADQVWMIYDPDRNKKLGMVNPTKNTENGETSEKDDEKETNNPNESHHVQIYISKNRNGRIGHVNMLFFPAYSRFAEPTKESSEILEKYE